MNTGRLDNPDLTDEEEAELIASTERGEWTPVANFAEEKAFLERLARNTLSKQRKRISISVPELDLIRLKRRAAEEGMPYQTLINSILHKYVSKD